MQKFKEGQAVFVIVQTVYQKEYSFPFEIFPAVILKINYQERFEYEVAVNIYGNSRVLVFHKESVFDNIFSTREEAQKEADRRNQPE